MLPLVSYSAGFGNLSNYTESNRIARVRPQREATGAGSSPTFTQLLVSSSSLC